MAANKDNVLALVAAASVGMEVLMKDQPGVYSAEDVVSASMTLASRAIDFACEGGSTPEETTMNKMACRQAIQQLMLKTTDNLKVF